MAALLSVPTASDTKSEAASAAFARGDYPAAEALALDAARAPSGEGKGSLLYLAGLARFREGDAAGALALLDRAWAARERPDEAGFRFNRASCLYELGRFGEAENQYLDAARLDISIAPLALVNAGFAALDGNDPARAGALAEQAGALAQGSARALVADLKAQVAAAGLELSHREYRFGLDSFDAGDFAAARAHFLRASALAPTDGRSRIMSGACALHLGDRESARADLLLSLRLELDPENAQIARDYLDALSPGLASRPGGWEASARTSAGFDSNALQTGFLEPNEFPGANTSTTPSAFVTADLGLAYRFHPRAQLFAEVAYGLDQLVYFAPDASDRSYQQHALLGSLEWTAREGLLFGLALGAQLSFTGLDQFRGLQLNGVSALWGWFEESERFSTRLELGVEPKLGLSEFDYLSGARYDGSISEELRASPAVFTLGYRFRAELIGTALEAVPPPVPPMPPVPTQLCPTGATCAQTLIDPFGYTSNTVWASARAAWGARWSFELNGGLEARDYTSDNVLEVTSDGQTQDVDRRRRHDNRWFGGASASLWLWPGMALTLRYDLVVNDSNIDSGAPDGAAGQCGPPNFDCHALDGEVRSYTKQVVSLGAAASW